MWDFITHYSPSFNGWKKGQGYCWNSWLEFYMICYRLICFSGQLNHEVIHSSS
jgi:hypothetical protein